MDCHEHAKRAPFWTCFEINSQQDAGEASYLGAAESQTRKREVERRWHTDP